MSKPTLDYARPTAKRRSRLWGDLMIIVFAPPTILCGGLLLIALILALIVKIVALIAQS